MMEPLIFIDRDRASSTSRQRFAVTGLAPTGYELEITIQG